MGLDIQYCNRTCICQWLSCMANNSPYIFSAVRILDHESFESCFITAVGYGWLFPLPIKISCICRSLLLSSLSLDDSVSLTILFSVLFWLFSDLTCLSCFSECSLFKGLVSCTLQIWALIYLVPCLRNNTGSSSPKTLAGPFHCEDEPHS